MILLSGLDILVALANAVAGVTLAAPLLLTLKLSGDHLTDAFVVIGLAVFTFSAAGAARRNARAVWRSRYSVAELRPMVHRAPAASRGGRRSLRSA